MKKSTRNILLAVILLVVLILLPFWPNLKQAVAGSEPAGELSGWTQPGYGECVPRAGGPVPAGDQV